MLSMLKVNFEILFPFSFQEFVKGLPKHLKIIDLLAACYN